MYNIIIANIKSYIFRLTSKKCDYTNFYDKIITHANIYDYKILYIRAIIILYIFIKYQGYSHFIAVYTHVYNFYKRVYYFLKISL